MTDLVEHNVRLASVESDDLSVPIPLIPITSGTTTEFTEYDSTVRIYRLFYSLLSCTYVTVEGSILITCCLVSPVVVTYDLLSGVNSSCVILPAVWCHQ